MIIEVKWLLTLCYLYNFRYSRSTIIFLNFPFFLNSGDLHLKCNAEVSFLIMKRHLFMGVSDGKDILD